MRNLYNVYATQVVTSESHPEGIFSNVSGFPKAIDTNTYNGDEDKALTVAKAEYYDEVKALKLAANANRTMWTVTLERADGRQILHESWGGFPEVSPEPEPDE